MTEAEFVAHMADPEWRLRHLYKIMGRRRGAEENYVLAMKLNPDGEDARGELSRMGWTRAAKVASHSSSDT